MFEKLHDLHAFLRTVIKRKLKLFSDLFVAIMCKMN
jgi:hypothetical protein